VRARVGGLASTLLAFGLGSCSADNGSGYIEIKSTPPSAPIALYLDSVRLDPIKNGTALLRQKVGVSRLQIDGDAGNLAVLCSIDVKKNRITSVTISTLSRPPRCLCGRTSGTDVAGNRTCIG
jgi:hypothetical protein